MNMNENGQSRMTVGGPAHAGSEASQGTQGGQQSGQGRQAGADARADQAAHAGRTDQGPASDPPRSTGIGGLKIGGPSRIIGRARGNPGLRAAAMGLGLFSIGLGLAELLAPRALARATGMPGKTTLVRAYGLREIVSGIGLLSSRDPRPWLWARVAGDALDVSTLATRALTGAGLTTGAKVAVGVAIPVALLDLAYARMADSRAQGQRESAAYDYSDRVGLSGSADAMRGAARDFEVPADMRTPAAMRAYGSV